MAHRTICVRVAEIVEGGTKQEFYDDLRKSLDLSRRAMNAAIAHCFTVDSELMSGGKCPKLYAYPVVREWFPGCASMASSVARAAEAKYRQYRWQIANGRVSVPNARSCPWPLLHNKSTKTFVVSERDGVLYAKIRLAGGPWRVRLSGGSAYRYQVAAITTAVANNSLGDSKMWVDRKHRAVIGISCDIPCDGETSRSGALHIATHREHFIVATKSGSDVPFVINGDEVRRWVAERDRRYQRLRQDRKAERVVKRIVNEQIEFVGRKYSQRVTDFCHRATASVVKYAMRRRIAEVVFDNTIKSFVPSFAWHQLTSMLRYKCEDAGIAFRDVTQRTAEPNMDKPHVYFRYSPATGLVKIGLTTNGVARGKSAMTDSPDAELTVLAIDNYPKSKLRQREKHWHAYFAGHRRHGEWFEGKPVIEWLREAGWLGNAGNLSQIAQILDVTDVTSRDGRLQAERDCLSGHMSRQVLAECVVNVRDTFVCEDAPEVTDRSNGG